MSSHPGSGQGCSDLLAAACNSAAELPPLPLSTDGPCKRTQAAEAATTKGMSLQAKAEMREMKLKLFEITSRMQALQENPSHDKGEALQLLREMEHIKRELTRPRDSQEVSSAEKATLAKIATPKEDDKGKDREEVHQRLRIKKDIREIERQLKAHRKQACLSKEQLWDLSGRLDSLKNELTNIKACPLLAWQFGSSTSLKAAPVINLGDRVSLQGLSRREAGQLLDLLDGGNGADAAGGAGASVWQLAWQQPDVKVSVLRSRETAGLRQELEAVQSAPPQLLAAHTASLKAPGISTIIRGFKGTLVLVEGDEDQELEVGALLRSLELRSRWRAAATGLQPSLVPEPLRTEVLEDVKLSQLVGQNAKHAQLWEEVKPLYALEFDDDLVELLTDDNCKLTFLVSADAATCEKVLYGFIIYCFWGPPLKTMSVSRVAVPVKYRSQGFGRQLVRWAVDRAKQTPKHECTRISLLATAPAVPFYERLNFSIIRDEDTPTGMAAEDGKQWMEYPVRR